MTIEREVGGNPPIFVHRLFQILLLMNRILGVLSFIFSFQNFDLGVEVCKNKELQKVRNMKCFESNNGAKNARPPGHLKGRKKEDSRIINGFSEIENQANYDHDDWGFEDKKSEVATGGRTTKSDKSKDLDGSGGLNPLLQRVVLRSTFLRAPRRISLARGAAPGSSRKSTAEATRRKTLALYGPRVAFYDGQDSLTDAGMEDSIESKNVVNESYGSHKATKPTYCPMLSS